MRSLLVAVACAALLLAGCGKKPDSGSPPSPSPESGSAAPGSPAAGSGGGAAIAQELEIGCAMCTYHMAGVSRCGPAVKVGEKTLRLVGFTPESEHAFCSETKRARVEGKIEGDTFVATKVEILPP